MLGQILRCFPHCCPRHIHYRNCGCSLSLHVQTITTCTPTAITTIDATTAAAPSGAYDNGRILVAYAKFSQLEEDVDWAVGDSVPASAVLDDLRSRGTPFRTWIPGHVEWAERPHGLRVLPTGESCLAGTLAIDYIGQVSEQLMRVELYAFSLTHVHVVCVQVVPQRGSGNGIELSCRVGIDEVCRRDEEVGLADEASMDAASRIAWAKQLPQRTQVVQLMATYERVPGRI
ncbi:hypothetical protein B5M09_006051 [Aphanomyces astaci]|uniref:Uncharacterized protein n=1 Tax=Aphanomyces astaci TaxID=112090 RepID=A0A425D4Q8_APHAT|nr:hypothetical protein B5M09_006051 [Aphanomyces astaci]